MAQYDTKCLANVGIQKDGTKAANGGNQGYTGQYFKYSYFVTGTPAAVTNINLGTLPCPCRYVGVSVALAAGTASTTNITISPKIVPFDTGTAAALNTTDQALGTAIVAFPAYTSTVNFDDQGATTTHGQNATSTATGITDAVLKTSSAAQGRQGDVVALSTSGTFTGASGIAVDVWFKAQNGAF